MCVSPDESETTKRQIKFQRRNGMYKPEVDVTKYCTFVGFMFLQGFRPWRSRDLLSNGLLVEPAFLAEEGSAPLWWASEERLGIIFNWPENLRDLCLRIEQINESGEIFASWENPLSSH
jgi:hypothetical protein